MDKELTVKLVKAMQAGDQSAAGQLYEASYQDIYYFIFKTVKEKELAEDLTQDTFIKIMENIGNLQEPEAFQGWSRQIAYHCCTAYFRKHKELLADENEDGDTVFDTLTEENEEFIPHEALDKEDLKKTILAMIDSLPQEQRSALLLRYYEELPVSQIARIQGVSEGTVKSRLNYGRKCVRKSVEDYEKKNGIKLHSFAILPLLLWLFRKQKLSQGKAITAKVSTSGGASAGTSKTASKAASKGFFATVGGKITAAVLAVALVGGGIAAAIGLAGNGDSDRKEKKRDDAPAQQVQEPEYAYGENTLSDQFGTKVGQRGQAQSLVITDQAVPEGVETVDVSLNTDGSVVMWMDGTTMYVTAPDGGPVYAPENGNYLFSAFTGIGENLESAAFDNFDTYYMKSAASMFYNCGKLKSLELSGWNMSQVENTSQMFAGCGELESLEVSSWDVGKVEDMSGMFQSCNALAELNVAGWNTGRVTNMAMMFELCYSLTELEVSAWDVSSVTDMNGMFSNCSSMISLKLSNWNTANVQNMEKMFYSCDALTALEVAGWNTGKVEFMGNMFAYSKSLSSLDVSGWDVSNVQDMQVMFRFTAIREMDLSGWDVSRVTNMCMMFSDCTQLTSLNVSGWNVGNVVNMDCMFYDCKQLTALDVAGWDVSNVRVFSGMFYNCASLTELAIGGWNMAEGAANYQMLEGCGVSS